MTEPTKRGVKPGEAEQDPGTGKFAKRRRVTPMQKAFVSNLENGMKKGEAAAAAGYAVPAVAASLTLSSPSVRELIDRRNQRKLDKAATVAADNTIRFLAGKLQMTPTQWKAHQWVMERKGWGTPKPEKDGNDNDLRSMTLADLEKMAQRVRSAREVAAVPELPADYVQVVDEGPGRGGDNP